MTRDWTVDDDGVSNNSECFAELCNEVERLIRSQAHALISGQAGNVARLIMGNLAHVHGLAPKKTTRKPRRPTTKGPR